MEFNWNYHFDEIRALFLVDRKPLKHIQSFFKQKYGCTASQKQWVQQLSRWKLKKNLTEKDWKFISHVVKKRKARMKESLVFVSGIQVPPERVNTGWRNHGYALNRPSYHKSPSPEPPSDDVVSVSTPTSLIWAPDMPWLQFQSRLKEYFALHKSLISPHTTHISRLSRNPDNMRLIYLPKIYLPMEISQAYNLVYRRLTLFIPEEFPNSHNERAYQITQGQGQGHLHAMLEVLVFSLSNNMLMTWVKDFRDYDTCVLGLLEIYRKIGFSFKGLFSTKDRTLQVFADEAFASIIRMGRLDLLKEFTACGLDIKARLKRPIFEEPQGTFRPLLPIQVASYHGHVEMEKFLSLYCHLDETGVSSIPRKPIAYYPPTGEPELSVWFHDELSDESTAAIITMDLPTLVEAIQRGELDTVARLVRGGARISMEAALAVIDSVMFETPPELLDVSMDITLDILVYAMEVKDVHRCSKFDLSALPCTENNGWGTTALGVAIMMVQTDPINHLITLKSSRYDPFALVAAVFVAGHSNDRSMVNFLLGLRTEATSNEECSKDALPYELAAYLTAISFQDIDTLQLLKDLGHFETHGSPFRPARTVHSFTRGRFPTLDEVGDPYGIQWVYQVVYVTRCALESGWSFLGLALGIGAEWGTMELLLQILPKPTCADVFVAFQHSANPQLIYRLLDLVEDIKDGDIRDYESPSSHTLLQAAIEAQVPCIVSRLLEIMSANVNFHFQYCPTLSSFVGNALQLACRNGNVEIIEMILEAGADANYPAPVDAGATALEFAMFRGDIQIARMLIDHGADCNAPVATIRGTTAIQSAAKNGQIEMVELLLEAGADVNSPAAACAGATALQYAAIKGYTKIAKMLIDHGADCNAPGAVECGRTAIEGAAEHGRIEMIELLLGNGVYTKGIPGRQYFRAIKLAMNETRYTAADILRDHRPWDEEDCRMFEEACTCQTKYQRKQCRHCEYGIHEQDMEGSTNESASGTSEINSTGSEESPGLEQQGDFADYAAVGTQPEVDHEDLFRFSIDGMECGLDLGAVEQEEHNLTHGLTTDDAGYPSCMDGPSPFSANESALENVNHPTIGPGIFDLGGRIVTAEDAATAEQVSPGTALQAVGDEENGEGPSDEWLENWLNFE